MALGPPGLVEGHWEASRLCRAALQVLMKRGGFCRILHHGKWMGVAAGLPGWVPLHRECTGRLAAIRPEPHWCYPARPQRDRCGSTAALRHLSGSTSTHMRSRTPRGRAGRSRTPRAAAACPQTQQLPGPSFPLCAQQQRCKAGNSLTCSSWAGGMLRAEQTRGIRAAGSKDGESITRSSLGAGHLLLPELCHHS